MAEFYTSTVTLTAWKKHRCEHCGQKFAYKMTREAEGVGYVGLLATPSEAVRESKKNAEALVAEKFQNEFDCIPCIGCGKYQEAMIRQMAGRQGRGKIVYAILCGLVAVCIGFGALILTVVVAVSKSTGIGAIIGCVLAWGASSLGVVGMVAFFALWSKGRNSFDPYEGEPPEYWIQWARKKGAKTPEEVKVLEEQRRAEEEADLAKQATFDFEDPEPKKKPRAAPKGAKPAVPPPAPLPGSAPPPPAKNPFDFG